MKVAFYKTRGTYWLAEQTTPFSKMCSVLQTYWGVKLRWLFVFTCVDCFRQKYHFVPYFLSEARRADIRLVLQFNCTGCSAALAEMSSHFQRNSSPVIIVITKLQRQKLRMKLRSYDSLILVKSRISLIMQSMFHRLRDVVTTINRWSRKLFFECRGAPFLTGGQVCYLKGYSPCLYRKFVCIHFSLFFFI